MLKYLRPQYADKTVLILDYPEKSPRTSFDELKNSHTISGLRINLSKSQLGWIGRKTILPKNYVTKWTVIGQLNFNY